MYSEPIAALNKILAIIDQKMAEYKNDYMRLPQSTRFANLKLILDLIADANKPNNTMKPVPGEAHEDLKRTCHDFSGESFKEI